MIKFKCNCCDGVYNSFDVHFTSICDNKCSFCIDKAYGGLSCDPKPKVNDICNTILSNKDGYDDVLFLGGEPCLYLDELLSCVKFIKEHTDLKVYVTSSVPYVCFLKKDIFFKLLDLVDGFNISAQHYDEKVADKIRRTRSQYDRQLFYKSLPHKDKIRINLNLAKPYLYKKDDVCDCLRYYSNLGFNSIKLSEIQHGTENFVSFEKIFGIHLGSSYSHGCQTWINAKDLIDGYGDTPLLLKRSCFMCEDTLKATPADLIKAVHHIFIKPNNKYAVIYENGELKKGWV